MIRLIRLIRRLGAPAPSRTPSVWARIIAELAGRIQAATYELLVLILEFDERAGWGDGFNGFRSCAHWLNWRTGLDLGAAREKVRVALALAELPHLSAAMQRVDLSYSKVRALTRVATPANETELLDFARCATAAQVERLVRAWRRVDRVAEAADDRRRQERRHLETWVDDDWMVVIRGRLSPEVGAVVRCALDAAADRLYQEAKAAEDDGVETSAGQRRADALGLVAEAALAADLDRGASTSGDRYQVVVHVDESVLVDGEDEQDGGLPGQSALEGMEGLHVSAETSRRLACDAAHRGHAPRVRGARARCGPQAADHFTRAAPGADDPGPRVPLSRLSGAPLRRPSCPALGPRVGRPGSTTWCGSAGVITVRCTRRDSG